MFSLKCSLVFFGGKPIVAKNENKFNENNAIAIHYDIGFC